MIRYFLAGIYIKHKQNMTTKILVSSCFLGEKVRYNAKVNALNNTHLAQWIAQGRVISICPEVSGGLSVPRMPAEINKQGVIMTQSGIDVTSAFTLGAQKALSVCKQHNIVYALLKENSPSCGSHFVYDGSFSNTKVTGQGATAQLLQQHNIQVFSENTIEQLATLVNADFD